MYTKDIMISRTSATRSLTVLVVFLSLIFIYEALLHRTSVHRRHPVSLTNVSQISEWMTFEYVAALFDIPPEYLQNTLGISDAKYPRITLKHYAKQKNVDASVVVSSVQDAVRLFIRNTRPQQ